MHLATSILFKFLIFTEMLIFGYMKKSIIIPILWGLYPILFLYSRNMGEVTILDLIIPIIGVILTTFLLYSIIGTLIKNDEKKTMIISWFFMFFFSYESIRTLFTRTSIWGISISQQRYFLILWMLIFIVGIVLILRQKKFLTYFQSMLLWTSLISVTFCSISIVTVMIKHLKISASAELEKNIDIQTPHLKIPASDSLQDIYYIILDSYANSKTLREFYNYNNSPFLDKMRKKGFFIAENSFSNYGYTALSLASSLNMKYLNYFLQVVGRVSDGKELWDMIKNNEVRRILESKGYSYIDEEAIKMKNIKEDFNISPFLVSLLSKTVLKQAVIEYNAYMRMDIILSSFDRLKCIAKSSSSPKFVYALFGCPHDPFIFDSTGKFTPPPHCISPYLPLKSLYLNQLIFINKKVEQVVDDILNLSKKQPIIIIQSDHGPWTATNWSMTDEFYRERMRNLMMFYGPKLLEGGLYDSMSPVNSFRIIFNKCFSEKYPLLKDESFFTPAFKNVTYDFKNVTAQVKGHSNLR